MSRFEKFLYLLQVALACMKLDPLTAVKYAALPFDPNIKTMIEQDRSVEVEQKVTEYVRFLGGGARPFWLDRGDGQEVTL